MTCTLVDDGYACLCDEGYEREGDVCVDIDECAQRALYNCHENADCENLPGGFECVCPAGLIDPAGDAATCLSVSAFALGDGHSCAIAEDDSLYCWGKNDTGQLGDGTTDDRHKPTRVGTAKDWSLIDVGGRYSRGVRTANDFFYWGEIKPRQSLAVFLPIVLGQSSNASSTSTS